MNATHTADAYREAATALVRHYPTTHDLMAAQVSIRVVHRPEPHAVPYVHFPDGRVSTSWETFHAVRRRQRPELYEDAAAQAA